MGARPGSCACGPGASRLVTPVRSGYPKGVGFIESQSVQTRTLALFALLLPCAAFADGLVRDLSTLCVDTSQFSPGKWAFGQEPDRATYICLGCPGGPVIRAYLLQSDSPDCKRYATFPTACLSWIAFNLIQIEHGSAPISRPGARPMAPKPACGQVKPLLPCWRRNVRNAIPPAR